MERAAAEICFAAALSCFEGDFAESEEGTDVLYQILLQSYQILGNILNLLFRSLILI